MTGPDAPPLALPLPALVLLLLALSWRSLPALGRGLEWLGMVGSLLAQELFWAVWEWVRGR